MKESTKFKKITERKFNSHNLKVKPSGMLHNFLKKMKEKNCGVTQQGPSPLAYRVGNIKLQ